MITQNRWQHILSVARKAKNLALKLRPKDEQFAQDMFLLGMLHDIGYEFCNDVCNHGAIGGKILERSKYKHWQEVANHGNVTIDNMSDELFILNYADMTTGSNGEDFSFDERLKDIADRYGADSSAYKKCVIEVEKLKSDIRSDNC